MPRFFKRFAEGVLDLEDLKARTKDLVAFVDAAASEHGFDSSEVVGVGFSNGANIAGSVLLQHPRLLRAAILLRPMVPFEPESSSALQGVPVFIGAGRTDMLVNPKEPEHLAEILEQGGADVQLSWVPGGHQLDPREIDAARAWLEDRLGSST